MPQPAGHGPDVVTAADHLGGGEVPQTVEVSVYASLCGNLPDIVRPRVGRNGSLEVAGEDRRVIGQLYSKVCGPIFMSCPLTA